MGITISNSVVLQSNANFGAGGAGTLIIDGNVFLGDGFTRTITVGNQVTNLSGSVSGASSLIKAGSGALRLSVSNSYTGSTIVNAGTVILGDAGALDSGSDTTIIASGATLRLSNSGTLLNTGTIVINDGGVDMNGALRSNGTGAFNGTVSLASNSTIGVDDSALTIGSITQSGSRMLTKEGSEVLSPINIRVASLTINSGTVKIRANGGDTGTSKVNSLSLNGGTLATVKLDLNDNDLVIDYSSTSPLTTVQSQITTAFNSGSWDGNGMTSSAAAANTSNAHTGLGYGEASIVFGLSGTGTATFSGQTVDATSVLVKCT